MRLVSFFVFSLALHVSALVYPVSFGAQRQPEIIHVALLPVEQESVGGGGRGGSGMAAPQAGPKSAVRTPPSALSRIEPEPAEDPKPRPTSMEAVAKVSDDSVAIAAAVAESAETYGTATSGPPNGSVVYDVGTGAGGSGMGGNGFGSSGNGARQANSSGHGNGQVAASFGGGVLTQARYRDTPPPDYPESARREGREGRVLLRVLVDEQGRTKQVEIDSSSGNEALDQSAAEAVKHWRFSPARYGDAPTASWVKIPVDFRLKEAK